MLVGGRDVRQLQMASLRRAMASVPQDMVLFNDTIYYNIAYGNLNACREAVEAAARAAQVGGREVLAACTTALVAPLAVFGGFERAAGRLAKCA